MVMEYLLNILIGLGLIALAFWASKFRLRGNKPAFWSIAILALVMRFIVGYLQGHKGIDYAMDALSVIAILFVVDTYLSGRLAKK
jgi:hypothetical protein